MFKVGDKVRLVKIPYDGLQIGHEDVVTRASEDGLRFDVRANGTSVKAFMNYAEYWELITPSRDDSRVTEEAVRLLEAAGWTRSTDGTLSPPPPKLTGNVAIYKNSGGITMAALKEEWDRWRYKQNSTLLAVVPWTEGGGL